MKEFFFTINYNSDGFTLIEVIISIVIIATFGLAFLTVFLVGSYENILTAGIKTESIVTAQTLVEVNTINLTEENTTPYLMAIVFNVEDPENMEYFSEKIIQHNGIILTIEKEFGRDKRAGKVNLTVFLPT